MQICLLTDKADYEQEDEEEHKAREKCIADNVLTLAFCVHHYLQTRVEV